MDRQCRLAGVLASMACMLAAGCSTPGGSKTGTPERAAVPAGVIDYTRAMAKLKSEGLAQANTLVVAPAPIALIRFTEVIEGEPLPVPGKLPAAGGPEVGASGQTIDLGEALALASGQNPRISYAQARIGEAVALAEGANALWLPTINLGFNYNKHDGRLQDVEGFVRDISRSSIATGLGAGAVGAGSPQRHGLAANFRLTDAIFQPRIADSLVNAQQAAFTATLNDTLLDTALAYLDLLDAYQQEAIARETLGHAEQLADLTKKFAASGQGTQADADRARTELTLRQNYVMRAEESIGTASARVAELLNLDPAQPLRPREPAVAPIALVSLSTTLPELLATGLSNRPELAESRALVTAAISALKREKCAPFIPNLQLGVSDMGLGGSPSSKIEHFGNRVDFDALLYWEVRNLGIGEMALRKGLSAKVRQAQFREIQVANSVGREVAEASTQVQARQKQMAIAESGIKAAESSYKLNLQRIKGGQGLPLEVLQSIQALDQARREYLRTVVDYNRAQFRLYRAMGWPATPNTITPLP